MGHQSANLIVPPVQMRQPTGGNLLGIVFNIGAVPLDEIGYCASFGFTGAEIPPFLDGRLGVLRPLAGIGQAEKVLVTSGAPMMRMRIVYEIDPPFATCFRIVAMASFFFLSGTRVARAALLSFGILLWKP